MGKKKKKKQKQSQQKQIPPAQLYQSGREYFEKGAYPEAVQQWRQIPDLSEQAKRQLAEACFRAGVFFYQSGNNLQQVVNFLTHAVNYAPGDARYHFHLGLAFERLGNAKKARSSYRKATGLDAQNLRYTLHLALAYFAENPDPSLQKELEQILNSFPADSPADQALKRILIALNAGKELVLDPSQIQEQKIQFLATLSELSRGDYSAALQSLKTIHFEDQSLPEGYRNYYLGLVCQFHNDPEQARSYWEKAFKLGVREEALAENLSAYYFNQGMDAVAVKDWDSAYLNFQEAVSFNPQDQESAGLAQQISRMRIAQLARQERYQEALKICYQLKEKDKDDDDLNHNIALLLDRLERHQEANLYWEELIRKWKKDWKDTPSQSKSALSEKLNRAHRHLGENFFKSGKPGPAIQALEKAVNYKPDDYQSHFELAEYYTDNEQWEQALKSYRAALKNHPEPLDILNNMAFVYGEMGEVEEMQATLEKVFEQDPDNAAAKDQLATYYSYQAENMMRFNPARALDFVDKGLDITPGNFTLLRLKATILLSIGKIKPAEAIYQEMIRQRPGDAHLLKAIALTYVFLNNESKANFYFAEMEKIAPHDPYLYLDIAELYGKRGKYKKKMEYFNKALEIGADDPNFYGEAVGFLFDSGEIPGAKELLAKALKKFPDAAYLYLMKAIIYLETMGSPEEVTSALNQAVKLGKAQNDQKVVQEAARLKNLIHGMLNEYVPFY